MISKVFYNHKGYEDHKYRQSRTKEMVRQFTLITRITLQIVLLNRKER